MNNQGASTGKSSARCRRRLCLAAPIIIVICVLLAIIFWPARRTADERLAEIEAARAIPDSENAATIYNELLRDPNATLLLNNLPESVSDDVFVRSRHQPWRSEEYPGLAAWVKQHQFIIDKLMQASQFDKCWFPISIDAADMSAVDRAPPMRHWAYLLAVAASNDLGEGRVDAAFAKWQCMLKIESHLRQQLESLDRALAHNIWRMVMGSVAMFVIEGEPGEVHLQQIEAMSPPVADDSAAYCRELSVIDDLRTRKLLESYGPLDRVRYYFWRSWFDYAVFGNLTGPDRESYRHLYLRYLSIGRGTRILIALKRYRNTDGHWPASLDEVESSLPQEILTDPSNKGCFVYQTVGDAFRLYSKGRNNVDEDGKWEFDAWEKGGCDDWVIWPLASQTRGAGGANQDTK